MMTARRPTTPSRSWSDPASGIHRRMGVARPLGAAAVAACVLLPSVTLADSVLWMGSYGNHVLARFNLSTMTRDQFIDMSPAIPYEIGNVATDLNTLYLGSYLEDSFIKADGQTAQIQSVGSYAGAPTHSGLLNYEDGSWNPATNTLWRDEHYAGQLFETDLAGTVLHNYQVVDESGAAMWGLYGLEWVNGVQYMTTRAGLFGYVDEATSASPTAVFHPLSLAGLEQIAPDFMLALAYDRDSGFMYMSAKALTGDGVLYRFKFTDPMHPTPAEFVATGIGPVGSMGWIQIPSPGTLSLAAISMVCAARRRR